MTTKLFGNVALHHERCPSCGYESFIREGVSVCCSAEVEYIDPRVQRESPTHSLHTKPACSIQDVILDRQGHTCFYCFQEFGSIYLDGGHKKVLRIEWDHFIPWSYDGNNSSKNFVAACHVCNQWKHNFIFPTAETARDFLQSKWANMSIRTNMLINR